MDIFEIVSILLGIFVVFRIFSKHSKVLEDKEETKDRNLKYIPPVYTNKKSLNERQKGILKLMNKKKVVVSLGHNALGYTTLEQWDAVKVTAKVNV